jgi:aquaporin Z
MMDALRAHWREYLIEATLLGVFMVAAGIVVTLLESSIQAIPQRLSDPFQRRVLVGIAMGLTAIALIYSPWGKRSGAHINPAVTLTFFRLGKITPWDTCFYILAQFIGGTLGVWGMALFWQSYFTRPPVSYIVTIPGLQGWAIALVTEFFLAFALMLTVLFTANNRSLAPFTGMFAGLLVAIFIIFASPLSGMSINPARTFASAFPARIWTDFWLYYFGPPLGMLLAAEVYRKYPYRPKSICAKLCPNRETPCPFRRCCQDLGDKL